MREFKISLFALVLLAAAVFSACASGEEEDDPGFDPAQAGWQGVAVRLGFDRVKLSTSRIYHALIASGSGMKKEKLDILTGEYIGPALELYAAAGAGFTLQRESRAGWKATVAVLGQKAELALVRAVIYKAEDVGDNRLLTYKVKSYDGPFPAWGGSGKTRYVFQGVWNMAAAELPANGEFDWVIMRALERMAEEMGPGEGPPLLAGRLWLLEYRFLYLSRDRLGLYCRLAVEEE